VSMKDDDLLALQDLDRQSLGTAVDGARHHLRGDHDGLGGPRAEPCHDRRRLAAIGHAVDHHACGSGQGGGSLAAWGTVSEWVAGVDDDDVGVAVQTPVLEPVVEDEMGGGRLPDRRGGAPHTVGIDHQRHRGQRPSQ